MICPPVASGKAANRVASLFPPTRDAAFARLRAVRPGEYARTRNALDGAVTGLSPYITHGMLPLREVVEVLRTRCGLSLRDKLMQEFGWRAYFHHVWRHAGDGIFASVHDGPLPDAAYATSLPADVVAGATGVPVIDQAVRALYANGYLHNHARMWLASYVVHLRKVHWRAGADWMYAHLLDGDLASNHLSWQWIAGTASRKPYLFNADNVARYAPTEWHSPGTVIDTDYASLEAQARLPAPAPVRVGAHLSIAPPPTRSAPPDDAGFAPPVEAMIAGRDVWLVHPWSLADPPSGRLPIAVVDTDFHRRWPWSDQRWAWVNSRMNEITTVRWAAPAAELASVLQSARSIAGWADPHLPWLASVLQLPPPPPAFREPGRRCHSFSAWFTRLAGFADESTVPQQADLFARL